MATYEPQPELLISNPQGWPGDPLLGELAALEMRTALAYDSPHRVMAGGAPSLDSSRAVSLLVAERGLAPGLYVISTTSKLQPLGVFSVERDATEPAWVAIAEGARMSMLAGGVLMFIVEVVAGDEAPPISPTGDMVHFIDIVRPIVGQDIIDYLTVADGGHYFSAMDEAAMRR